MLAAGDELHLVADARVRQHLVEVLGCVVEREAVLGAAIEGQRQLAVAQRGRERGRVVGAPALQLTPEDAAQVVAETRKKLVVAAPPRGRIIEELGLPRRERVRARVQQ